MDATFAALQALHPRFWIRATDSLRPGMAGRALLDLRALLLIAANPVAAPSTQ